MNKAQESSNSIMHYRQNPLGSIQYVDLWNRTSRRTSGGWAVGSNHIFCGSIPGHFV
jgi:hypothetical protein